MVCDYYNILARLSNEILYGMFGKVEIYGFLDMDLHLYNGNVHTKPCSGVASGGIMVDDYVEDNIGKAYTLQMVTKEKGVNVIKTKKKWQLSVEVMVVQLFEWKPGWQRGWVGNRSEVQHISLYNFPDFVQINYENKHENYSMKLVGETTKVNEVNIMQVLKKFVEKNKTGVICGVNFALVSLVDDGSCLKNFEREGKHPYGVCSREKLSGNALVCLWDRWKFKPGWIKMSWAELLPAAKNGSDGAVAYGDFGAEFPTELVPSFQGDIIIASQNVIRMISHLNIIQDGISSKAVAVFRGADAILIMSETGQSTIAWWCSVRLRGLHVQSFRSFYCCTNKCKCYYSVIWVMKFNKSWASSQRGHCGLILYFMVHYLLRDGASDGDKMNVEVGRVAREREWRPPWHVTKTASSVNGRFEWHPPWYFVTIHPNANRRTKCRAPWNGSNQRVPGFSCYFSLIYFMILGVKNLLRVEYCYVSFLVYLGYKYFAFYMGCFLFV
ncbi:uncharacterized protein LOC143570662 [Bidens hawaiensis]|uniref:uncharacterized protein LOC143570662 n=1 Tax=Bidens hawaiensis TaxID=980011 RepID=UPI00404A423B